MLKVTVVDKKSKNEILVVNLPETFTEDMVLNPDDREEVYDKLVKRVTDLLTYCYYSCVDLFKFRICFSKYYYDYTCPGVWYEKKDGKKDEN